MRKGLFTKKIVSYICAVTMVFSSFAGMNIARPEQVSAADGISVPIGEFSVTEGQTDTYKGWYAAETKITTSDYKYAEMTYTGTGEAFNETRFIFADASGKTLPEVWFATWQASKFVTVDGTDVPVATETEQTVVIDLEASGVDVSKGFEGLHIHAGNSLTGTVNITSFKFLKEKPGSGDAGETTADTPDEASTIAIPELKTIEVTEGQTDTYKGWYAAATKATPEYKYLQFTYTGTGDAFNETRFIFADASGKTMPAVWFATWQASKFVTVDGKDVPVPTAEPQTVVIDLEASGVDVSKGFEGLHVHAGNSLTGTVNFSDVKLQTTPKVTKAETPVETTEAPTEETTEAPTEETTTPEPTTAADPSTGIKLDDVASGMNKTMHIDQVASDAKDDTFYDYQGWVTFKDLATKDFKYLKFTYTGDITNFRLQFEAKDKSKQGPFWFDSNQDLHFVTADGSPIQLVGNDTTVVIDLEASGVDMSKFNNGFHMHANSSKSAAFDATIKDAVLFGGVPTPPETTEPSTGETTTPQPTTAADPSTGIKLDDELSGMNKKMHIDKLAKNSKDDVLYAYQGWVTFKDLANKDFKYLKFTYTGDITNFRLQFEDKKGNKQGPFWFDPEQDVHFVTADGSPIQLVGNNTTVVIDLEASGVDMSKFNNGFHMHANSTKDAAFDVTIKDAVLYGGVPTPHPTTVAPTKKSTTVAKPGTASVKKATKKKASTKVKISLKKVKKAKGYYVQISTSKKFKKVLVKKYVKKVSFTLKSKKVKNKKKLYVRAKAYKLNGKKKVYSKKWSKVKKVKITK